MVITDLRFALLMLASLAVVPPAYSQQPPDSVVSDSFGNTAMGTDALLNNGVPGINSQSFYNTAGGANALEANTTGYRNTAFGGWALVVNTTGAWNSAFGEASLFSNTIGSYLTAVGQGTLYSNTQGNYNTAVGFWAMGDNLSGSANTAAGYYALYNNTTGSNNSAIGDEALESNTTGSGNNAQGYQAMYSNTTGSNNSGIGAGALYSSTAGIGNNAVGLTALENMLAGNRNTAVGNNAGLNLVSGSYNTYIGWGVNGSAGVTSTQENYVTRIGVTYADPNVEGSPRTYISGIYNVPLSGNTVVVTSTGQLGVAAVSSERFKTGIAAMAESTDKLSQLRPVTFKLKTDATGVVQYGLVAEEVARVYPELIIRDENGRIDGVRYDELAPMLLNEMQKAQEHARAQDATIRDLREQVARVNDLQQRLEAVLRQLKVSDDLLAQR
jgi:hypothetical protein